MTGTTLDLGERFEREMGHLGFFAKLSPDTRAKEAVIITEEIERLIRNDEFHGLAYVVLPPHSISTSTWGERLQLPYKNKLLCVDRAHNRAKLVEYLQRHKCLAIHDFAVSDVKDVGLRIEPGTLLDKVYEQPTTGGRFAAAGLLMYGVGGAIVGGAADALAAKLFAKEFHFHIQLRLETGQKLDMRYLYEKMVYSGATEASLRATLNDILTHLGMLLSFLDDNIGKPVKKLWMTRY